jgi:hypothetical protein
MTLSTMWPLTDTALHLIDEANLISARRYGIELDLESLWGTSLPGPDAVLDPGVLTARMRALDEQLLGVLVHAWPAPRDPVVIALRSQAKDLRAALHARGARPLPTPQRRPGPARASRNFAA